MANASGRIRVIVEENGGPIEFQVSLSKSGSMKWGAGRYLLTGNPCVRLSEHFAKRLRDAVTLIREMEEEISK